MASYLGGFSPLKYKNGTPYNGAVQRYVAQGAIFVGDFCKLNGAGATPTAGPGASTRPLKGVVVATNGATESVLGVVVGYVQLPTAIDTPIGATSAIVSGTQVLVADDPNIIFIGRLSGSSAFTDANLGLNTVINTGTAGANNRSGQLIDAAVANNAAAPLKVIDYVDAPDNVNAASSVVMLQVIINNSQIAPATGQAGV